MKKEKLILFYLKVFVIERRKKLKKLNDYDENVINLFIKQA